jgi:hypothetical protein
VNAFTFATNVHLLPDEIAAPLAIDLRVCDALADDEALVSDHGSRACV